MNLKSRLNETGIIVAPGVFDAWSALLAERAGFEAVYLSGASIAYTRLGRPDIGLVSLTEVADTLGCIRERVSLPVIVDADTGFGNALNVRRTVNLLERAGGGVGMGTGAGRDAGKLAIQLEDQTQPKRCGHLDGKTLIPAAEMAGKIRAALDARLASDTLIIARTDAVAVEGVERALERAEIYLEAGADVLFIEALRSPDEMRQATSRFKGRVPLLANMVEGGKTPLMSGAELQKIGYSIVIFPGGLVRALSRTAGEYFSSLKATGSTAAFSDRMLDFTELNALVGTPEMLELGKRYDRDH